ncbi:hypothetical protein MSG28_010799 [Choristoneura fumiferana]|uniref:Uncharacterized protein n=1 Tax=Choristoneura fumiferana TaxID=7141 RepID=A0ACC0KNZ8_CHOFU|nr:hypothetical protein MSG28_010799 [Choristoneura fumiferana]
MSGGWGAATLTHRLLREATLLCPSPLPGNEGDTMQKTTRVSIIASMVPDEIINEHSDHSVRRYETALMFIDVSGFTELCETYTKAGRGGPSRLTQVLNSYIGAMVQEILTHGGDVLKFSGDAFLSMWKKSSNLAMQDVVHTAIDCGLSIQKNYGTFHTDVGVILKVKVAISAGVSHFSIIGGVTQSHYVIVGQPVWDVKMAEYVSTAGDVLTAASAWMYVNAAEYYTQPSGDGRHTKVLGVGAAWKRVEKIEFTLGVDRDSESLNFKRLSPRTEHERNFFREFSLRPAVVSAIRSTWWPTLRQFMVKPVLRAVDNDEPMEFLAEVRRVVIVFLNIITKSVSEELLIHIVDTAYKIVCSVSSSSGGLVNKVSMFDKDMMFLVVFGLRGLKHEDEAQKALLCALTLKESLNDPNIISAARLMMVYPSKITCDKETFLRSKLDQEFFRLLEPKPLKGILKPGPVYEFNKLMWPQRSSCWRHPILGRNAEIRKYKMTLLNALKQQHQKFTRYRDHVYGVVFLGPDAVGKTRLVEECIAVTPKCIQVYRIRLTQAGKTLSSLSIVVIEEALFADDESWRLLLILMEGKSIFVVMTICDDSSLSETAYKCLSNNMLLKIRLGGIERWYHAALACQLLDVQAIPADLEKVIQSASDGMPGWIQNFVISLVQRGALSVVTVTQPEALQAGAVMPPPSLLNVDQPIEYDNLKDWMESCFKLQESNVSLGDPLHKIENRPPGPSTDNIQMAVLADSYNFEDMKVDMTMDAVAKLFLIRVLECEGGDFTRDGSMVLVHPAPAPVAIKPPYCACLGHEMHARALLYLERYTLRCIACGAGCFTRLLGERCDDGLIKQSEELKNTCQAIRALAAETLVAGEQIVITDDSSELPVSM